MSVQSAASRVIIPARRLWTPAEITTAAWWDAADATTFTLSTLEVSQWDDKSGNAHHLSQGTSANRPSRQATGFNSLPCVRFDGSNDQLNVAGTLSQADGQRIFAVVDTTSIGTASRVFLNRHLANGGSAPYEPAIYFGGNTNYRPTIYWGTGSGGFLATWGTDVRRKAIVEWLIASSTVKVNVDAGTETTGSHSATLLSHWTNMGQSSVQQIAVDVAETVIVNSPSADTIARIQGYLAHKWGLASLLPGGHTYKSTRPYV